MSVSNKEGNHEGVVTMDSKEMLKTINEMMDSKLGGFNETVNALTETVSEIQSEIKEIIDGQNKIQTELKEFRVEASNNFDNLENKLNDLEGTNGANHIAINTSIGKVNESIEDIEVDIKMIKKIIVINSKDIEEVTVAK